MRYKTAAINFIKTIFVALARAPQLFHFASNMKKIFDLQPFVFNLE